MLRGLGYALASVVIISMAGCQTDQPTPSPFPASDAQAKVTISRQSDFLYLTTPAIVTLDGFHVADLAHGGVYSGTVPAGPAVVTVSAFAAPGQSSLKFNAEPGRSYAFIVSANASNWTAGLTGAALLGPLGSLGAQVEEGGGPFSIAAAP